MAGELRGHSSCISTACIRSPDFRIRRRSWMETATPDVLSASSTDDKIAWYENLLPRAPSIGATQASPGAPVYVNNANLTPGNEYYNIFSTTPCPGAVGSGPYLGLCAASLGDFLAQVSLPIGAAPFHIIAPSSHVNWGPYTLPPVIVDAVCFDYTGGVLGPVSPVFRITVQ